MIKFSGHKIYGIELLSVISRLQKKFVKRDIDYWITEV